MKKGKSRGEGEVYVRMDADEALQAKKDLLEVTASVINLQMISGSMKEKGKAELKQRSQAKSELKGMQVLMNKLGSELPNPEHIMEEPEAETVGGLTAKGLAGIKPIPLKSKKVPRPKEAKDADLLSKGRRASLNQELLDIKRRLENLS